ncbi:MAG: DUF3788 family protein [Fibromonadaceae bacterium]|nr:DUF3788 family protein [Fibromonadaceae bacterium]
MASDIDFVNYVVDQIKDVGAISQKKMFGEYMVYVNQKPIILICNNTAYVKKLDCVKEFHKTEETGYPYKGAKEHYILDVDNREALKSIVQALEKIIPIPKKKSKSEKKNAEKQILTNPIEKPENNILKKALGKNYNLYMEFVNKINVQNLILEWNYYNDGKSWLGKVLNKKKNLCWLSIWNTGFKLTFFFTEKTIKGIQGFKISKPTGKLLPIIILIESKKKMNDALKILEYKMSLK